MARKNITGNSSCMCVICEDPIDGDYFEGGKNPCDFFISGGIYCKYAYIVYLDQSQQWACGNNNAILCMVGENK